MNTYIFPGFSIKNKDWAEQTQNNLKESHDTSIVYWKHWESGKADPNWIGAEVNNLFEMVKGQKVNIIAKSIGTLVTMKLLLESRDSINKIVLSGIPLHDLSEAGKENYNVLKNFPTDKVLCIQNDEDNHGNFQEVNQFINSINPNIHIISKHRSDHEYPYFTDFIEFISSK